MSRHLTLTRDTFSIMVALSAGSQTGRQVQSQIVGDTLGVHVRDSVVYATLHRLVDLGWAENVQGGYALTQRGRYVLKTESKTYELLIGQVKKRLG